MPRLRRNEWNFAHRAAELITGILQETASGDSPLGHAEPELTEFRGAKRLDLVIFKRAEPEVPLVTGELKVPWDAAGRSPYSSKLLEDAHLKASKAGALYFITWNIRRVVVWKTDDPGVELPARVVYDDEMVSFPLRSEADLASPQVATALEEGVRALVDFLTSLLSGPPQPVFLPLDLLFIARLEAALDFPIEATSRALASQLGTRRFRLALERWMREEQGWVVSRSEEQGNIDRAARFTAYVLVNRLCFYNALRRRFPLPRLDVPNSLRTGDQLHRRLRNAYAQALRYTGDYETVFEENFGDDLPLLADEAVGEWRNLIRSLEKYDFAEIPLDIVGAMYERLIRPEERHRFGQHYTQPALVDLVNAFAIRRGDATVLDPACGGGTFLVRAYARRQYLDSRQAHGELIANLYGCDISGYACHLSTVNLAIRDLVDEDNFPRIRRGDFLRFDPGSVFVEQPTRVQAGGLVTDRVPVMLRPKQCDAVVGNPPYISARTMSPTERAAAIRLVQRDWPGYNWDRASDIYLYFFTHAAHFVKPDGVIGLLTQSAWLDGEYGVPLQSWMLSNFRIVAVLESEVEPWFTDARVATAVTILEPEREEGRRNANPVRFVQFRRRLREAVVGAGQETDRQRAMEALRDAILSLEVDEEWDAARVRMVPQFELHGAGTRTSGDYEGSRWGRYLRCPNTLYRMSAATPDRFAPVEELAAVRRGLTTNCDDFFLVSDVSQETVERLLGTREFSARFGVPRSAVVEGRVRIVRRSDGVELPLESDYLRPILRTARDVDWFATRHLPRESLAVLLPSEERSLSKLGRLYVEAGEKEGYHASPSFEALRRAGRSWFSLRTPEIAPVLFVKTIQYSPLTLWNDALFLANQRLYEVQPAEGLDAEGVCAILNSTLFATERYASVRTLGREAAIDAEVFAVRRMLAPNLRLLSDTERDELGGLMRALSNRRAGPILEDALAEASLNAAQRHILKHPVSEEVWPAELRDPVRQAIDRLALKATGISAADGDMTLKALYNDLLQHTRRLKVLEIEAQRNRQGDSLGRGVSARDLADEIWEHLRIAPRSLPWDFVGSSDGREVRLPSTGRVVAVAPSLFDSSRKFLLRVGKKEFALDTPEQVDYLRFLAENGVTGPIPIPSPRECKTALSEMEDYLASLRAELLTAGREVTSDVDLLRRIVTEGLRRVLRP